MSGFHRNPGQFLRLRNEEMAVAMEVANQNLEQDPDPDILGNQNIRNHALVPMQVDPVIELANPDEDIEEDDDDSILNWNLLEICDQDEGFEVHENMDSHDDNNNAREEPMLVSVQEQLHLFQFGRDEPIPSGGQPEPPNSPNSNENHPIPTHFFPPEESQPSIFVSSEPLPGTPITDEDDVEIVADSETSGYNDSQDMLPKEDEPIIASDDPTGSGAGTSNTNNIYPVDNVSGYITDDDDSNYPPMPVLEPQVPWPPVRKERSPSPEIETRSRPIRRAAIAVMRSGLPRRNLRSSIRSRSSSSGMGRDQGYDEDETDNEQLATVKGRRKRPRSESPPGPHTRSRSGIIKKINALSPGMVWQSNQDQNKWKDIERSTMTLRSKRRILSDYDMKM